LDDKEKPRDFLVPTFSWTDAKTELKKVDEFRYTNLKSASLRKELFEDLMMTRVLLKPG
jgi:hypothetical protein